MTGVAEKTTLASLDLGGGSSRRSEQDYPFVAPDSIVIDAKKRKNEGRAHMQKVMRLASKSKVQKMSYRQKLLPKVWKKAEARWRELERPTMALIFAEGAYISADGQNPRIKSKLLKDGKANMAKALGALKTESGHQQTWKAMQHPLEISPIAPILKAPKETSGLAL